MNVPVLAVSLFLGLLTFKILNHFLVKLDEVILESFLFLVDGFHRSQVIMSGIDV